jgi:hypothetical protein
MALITTPADIKRHNSAVAADMKLASLQSFIDDAINKHIIPGIGRKTYNQMIASPESLTDVQKGLYQLLQKSCVGFMLAYYSGSGSLQINDAGIFVLKSGNQLPASDKKLMTLRDDSFETGFNALELAINYMESYLADFPIYRDSPERKTNRSLLINCAAEFQSAGINIKGSSSVYHVLRTYQVDAERTYINPLLGDELSALLREVILNGNGTEIQKQLIKEVQRPVATFTMMEAIPWMALSIDATGVYTLSNSVGGMAANVETKATADSGRLQRAMFILQAKGDQQLETLRKWIKKRKAEFSAVYTPPDLVDINGDLTSNVIFL